MGVGAASLRPVALAPVFMILALLAGALVRLDQFSTQILIDDEWHAVHRLLAAAGPAEIFGTFGYADHSVPLTLLYWLQASWFELDELAMRWPMLLAGLSTLVLFPLYVARELGRREAVLFAWLLAFSPMLVNYSRMARPYALTLLLAWLAYWAFYRYLKADRGTAHGVLAAFCMVLAAWLHPIIVLFLAAPFLLEGIDALRTSRQARRRRLGRLLLLGVPVAAGSLLLLLPTLLSDPAALQNKLGTHTMSIDTALGAWHLWTGTGSAAVALFFLLLVVAGWSRTWREFDLMRPALLGLGLTLAAIVVVKPDWIQLPIVLARYLLPAVPLLLLMAAVGTVSAVDTLRRRFQRVPEPLLVLALTVPLLAQAFQSPLPSSLRRPNNETLHSYFQFDYRTDRNMMRALVEAIPTSAFWEQLASNPRGTLRIAVSPWQFESYLWAGPLWEADSGQHVVPGLLAGLCVDARPGEYARGQGMDLDNVVFLAEADDLLEEGIDLIVYQKPFAQVIAGVRREVGNELPGCLSALAERHGPPIHEDAAVAVFAVRRGDVAIGHPDAGHAPAGRGQAHDVPPEAEQ